MLLELDIENQLSVSAVIFCHIRPLSRLGLRL